VGPDKRTLKEACYLLLNCSLFSGLRSEERAEVAALARVRTFNAGETVFAIGLPGDQMMALLSGTIRISVPSSGGKELLLAVIQPGEVFGELAVLDGKERSADAVAETACTVAVLDRRQILSFFERNPSAWPSLVKVLCQRLRHTNQVFAEVALLELPVRLAKAMLRVLHWEADSAAAEPAKIRFSQRELANMLGGSRESVNKCLQIGSVLASFAFQKVRSSFPIVARSKALQSRPDVKFPVFDTIQARAFKRGHAGARKTGICRRTKQFTP